MGSDTSNMICASIVIDSLIKPLITNKFCCRKIHQQLHLCISGTKRSSLFFFCLTRHTALSCRKYVFAITSSCWLYQTSMGLLATHLDSFYWNTLHILCLGAEECILSIVKSGNSLFAKLVYFITGDSFYQMNSMSDSLFCKTWTTMSKLKIDI